jgi:DNA polymerase III epsilon subunit-like protein
VAGCEREEAVLGLLTAFCGDLPLVAHNAPFDVKFLGAAFERHRIPAPAGAVYDTCALARGMFPSLSDYRLGTLADFFELRPERLHRAVEDAATCGLLILRLVETLRRNGEPGDWPALQTRLGRKELRLPMIAPPPPQLDLF